MDVNQGAWRPRVAGALLLVCLCALAPAASAQLVSGTVRDSASQLPLAGTKVLVLDAAGRAAAQGATDQQGRFRLSPWGVRSGRRATPGTLRLRVLRIGFRPKEVPISRADAGREIDVGLTSFPIVLEEVQVMAVTCPKRADRATALAVLQEARLALYASVLARSQSSASMTRLLYDRRIDPISGRTLSQHVRKQVTTGRSEPFSATRIASSFGRDGFVTDSAGDHTYLGPDAESLLDDSFIHENCFKINPPDRARPQQVALGFEPVDHEDGSLDLVGTLWVDTLTRVVKDLTFRYVGLDRTTSALVPEGRLSFRELPNGVVIVDRWSLRLLGGNAREEGAVPEIGGEIARASWPDGSSWSAPLGTLRLHAVDRQGRPAAESAVRLVGTDYAADIDSGATVTLSDLLPGPYTASVYDARLAVLGLQSASTFRFTAERDSTKEALLQVETADEIARRRCGQELPAPGKAWLLGRVVTPDGRPVREARWSIRDQAGVSLVDDGHVDDDGWFQWCQLPVNTRVAIDVWRDDRRVNESRIVMDRLTTLHFVLPQ
jgi:hypothetical protein